MKTKKITTCSITSILRFVTSFPHPHISLSPFPGCLVYAVELCVPWVGLEDGGKGRRKGGGQGEQEGGKSRRGRMGMKMYSSQKQ